MLFIIQIFSAGKTFQVNFVPRLLSSLKMPVITWEQEKVRVAYKLIIIDCNAPAHLIIFFSSDIIFMIFSGYILLAIIQLFT